MFRFGKLPQEIQCHIFAFVELKTLIQARLVCKQWGNDLILRDQVWKAMFQKTFILDTTHQLQEQNWYLEFRERIKWARFDFHHHCRSIEVSSTATTVSCCKDTSGTYLPARGCKSMKSGKSSFCVVVENCQDIFGATQKPLCAVGVGGVKMDCSSDYMTFLASNLGMGYYSSGISYLLGTQMTVLPTKQPPYWVSDRIGVFLDLDCHTIAFFKNDQIVGEPFKIPEKVRGQELYPVVLMCSGLVLSIHNWKPPK